MRGGSNAPDNLITACRTCNSRRRALPFTRFARIRAAAIRKQAARPLNMALARDIIASRVVAA
jgi:5-methylcytosine-specific restriction endonuclease McrA